MAKPIVYAGTEYDSVEAMPPSVRAAYQTQLAADTRDLNQMLGEAGLDETGEPLTKAWGGARPDGSVPAPAAFDAVTGLGPATAVYPRDGLQLMPHLGTPHATDLVLYRDGLAYQAGGKDVHPWRWEEVAVIQSNIWQRTHQGSAHEYTLTKTSGEKLILDNGLKDVGVALDTIKAAVFARLGPALAQRYQAGEALAFGPVSVQRQHGLTLDGRLYAWDAIQDIKVADGRFKITLRDGKQHEARVSAMPNIEALGRVIGVAVGTFDLSYH